MLFCLHGFSLSVFPPKWIPIFRWMWTNCSSDLTLILDFWWLPILWTTACFLSLFGVREAVWPVKRWRWWNNSNEVQQRDHNKRARIVLLLLTTYHIHYLQSPIKSEYDERNVLILLELSEIYFFVSTSVHWLADDLFNLSPSLTPFQLGMAPAPCDPR